jgi:3'-phosphoadenosine 5'-phosphosulfate sulfotransferase (PAPS reductase)/FAD synthetase
MGKKAAEEKTITGSCMIAASLSRSPSRSDSRRASLYLCGRILMQLMPREVDALIASANRVFETAYCGGAYCMFPLFSGGHDSICATHLASQHRAFNGNVYHINTGIGSKYTREFVEKTAKSLGWNLVVLKSPISYEDCVRDHGFPGPAGHQYIYSRLKERCINQLVK